MSNQTLNIIRDAVSPKPEKYNILTFSTHERYETQIAKTGHNFYAFNANEMKKWLNDVVLRGDNIVFPYAMDEIETFIRF